MSVLGDFADTIFNWTEGKPLPESGSKLPASIFSYQKEFVIIYKQCKNIVDELTLIDARAGGLLASRLNNYHANYTRSENKYIAYMDMLITYIDDLESNLVEIKSLVSEIKNFKIYLIELSEDNDKLSQISGASSGYYWFILGGVGIIGAAAYFYFRKK